MTSNEMEDRLTQKFPAAVVAVIDLTGGSNHFEVRIQDKDLKTLPRIRQHQAVMDVFAAELKTGEVHALTIKVL